VAKGFRSSAGIVGSMVLGIGVVAGGVPSSAIATPALETTEGPKTSGTGPPPCPAPKPMTFAEQTYVDKSRAGGEPTVEMHPDGTLLYGAHAGTTHVYAPEAGDEDSAAFAENYTGQAYYWASDDLGKTWHFADRTLPPDGLAGSGFSDPEFAVDAAGNVYISEINLANVAVSKSTDSGHTYRLENFFGQDMEDRQWMAADAENVLYMTGNSFGGGTVPNDPVGNVGHHLFKSTDGGKTFAPGIEDPGGLGDIEVDKRDGTLYETHYVDGTLRMAAFRGARDDAFTPEMGTIADGVDLSAHWPSFDIDPGGNLYVTWDETGEGDRAAGVYYSYSQDGGSTWADAVRVDTGGNTDIWPWLAVGDEGKVAIAWLEADRELPGNNPETPGEHGWRLTAAVTLDGLGCARSGAPGFSVSTATPDPVHRGTICNGGTVCQAQGVDRRMGDFFTIEIDGTGRMWAGYSDTRQGGAVALPGFVRQTGGPVLVEDPRNG
jgi:hypothetical protein